MNFIPLYAFLLLLLNLRTFCLIYPLILMISLLFFFFLVCLKSFIILYLIYSFLMVSDFERLSICFLAVYLYISLENCPLNSFPIL